MTSICIQILPENTQAIVPATNQYIMATGKQALELLQSAVQAIPVPLLQDAIGVAIKIIKVCEGCGIIHQKSTTLFCLQCLSGRISCTRKSQRDARESRSSDDRNRG